MVMSPSVAVSCPTCGIPARWPTSIGLELLETEYSDCMGWSDFRKNCRDKMPRRSAPMLSSEPIKVWPRIRKLTNERRLAIYVHLDHGCFAIYHRLPSDRKSTRLNSS